MRSLALELACILCAFVPTAAPAAGQRDAPECTTPVVGAGDSLSIGVPVVIVARVHADAVVFETDPDVRVTVNGCEPQTGEFVTNSNLPDTIVPGVRYTDIEVTAEYRAVLTLECRAPEEIVVRLCEELRRRD